MLLHYLGKLKIQIVCRYWRKSKQIAFLIASTFVIHPQVLIFSVFKIAIFSPYWLQIKFCSVTVYLFLFAINLWRRKFVTADVTAVSVNNQHDIKRREHGKWNSWSAPLRCTVMQAIWSLTMKPDTIWWTICSSIQHGIYCSKWISATFLFCLPQSRSCSQHVTLESY